MLSKVGVSQRVCVIVLVVFVGIMGDFAWKPLMKQVGPASGIMPLCIAAPSVGGGGQPAGEVSPTA